ncbi:hypothetical protein AVEN_137825-1 [Araneus ventricosus]|uniref:Uncharacterized protein n=1 Tax=Araneus ventricosus TaxID=182803 RepID=A0A4Y2M091_ARAVE|nr:hypothetical protein AVEN_137825-1 [Araneus ventricosus]
MTVWTVEVIKSLSFKDEKSHFENKAALKGLAVDQPSGIWLQMKYFKKTGQLTPASKPSQTTLSWFPMPRLESNLSHKLTNLLLNSPPGQAKTNSKFQQKKQIISLSASSLGDLPFAGKAKELKEPMLLNISEFILMKR